ncbi:hypothetical protein [Marinimicrobium sp. ABcell2]|uniref:hypothetical protein n=1 Tax=Marinimicrobium sp. ABcell2 TaxID=3069751 RepID=UPI0027AFED6F|nr:hypothetical protein [Marinimicrobium sp. ABcell2]MDQ2077460.1 hypothetical protein [Marinimicrobium sp. ABcell2]
MTERVIDTTYRLEENSGKWFVTLMAHLPPILWAGKEFDSREAAVHWCGEALKNSGKKTGYWVLHRPSESDNLAKAASAIAIGNPDVIVIGGTSEVPLAFHDLMDAGHTVTPSSRGVLAKDLERIADLTGWSVAGINVTAQPAEANEGSPVQQESFPRI